MEYYKKTLELAKTNAEDLNNTAAKRDLVLSYNKVGDVLDSSGDGKGALEHSAQALGLQQEIAAADPKNFEIRRQIAGTFKRMSYAQTTTKDAEGARTSFENALRQYEQLIAVDPNDKKLPREIAIISQEIGKSYAKEAEQSDRAANLRKALEWEEKSLRTFTQLKEAGTLPEFDFKIIKEVETEIAEIKAKLK